jgi:hypothetical protein
MTSKIDMRLKYQAGIFVNAQDIGPTPTAMTELIDLFKDKGLVPSVFYELGGHVASSGQSFGLPGQARVRLASPTNEWAVSFASTRIDIYKSPTDASGSNLGELNDFVSQALDVFQRITVKYGKAANRMVMASNSLLPEFPQKQLENVYRKLFRPTRFFESNAPFEWIWRSASRTPVKIMALEDAMNVICTLQRSRMELTGPEGLNKTDRIQLAFDFNTTDLNLEYRFGLPHIGSFFTQAKDLHESLSAEVLSFVYD